MDIDMRDILELLLKKTSLREITGTLEHLCWDRHAAYTNTKEIQESWRDYAIQLRDLDLDGPGEG